MSQNPDNDSSPCQPVYSSFSITKAISHVFDSAASRGYKVVVSAPYKFIPAALLVPKVSAGYPLLDSPSPSYDEFIATSSNLTTVQADTNSYMAINLAFYRDWQSRAHQIRMSRNRAFCVGNLSLALEEVGALYAAGSNGASALLTLIPTAGALIGAPSRELWVLYKLMPIAGFLSMLLSLGGNIVPMEVTDYERVDALSYHGMVPTADHKTSDVVLKPTGETEAEHFASQVCLRAKDSIGARSSVKIWIGVIVQGFWLSCILAACWFLESGTVITWWCLNSGWMYFWFGIVASSSILENIACAPFSNQWTIRISRAPNLMIDDDAPWVVQEIHEKRGGSVSKFNNLETITRVTTEDLLRSPSEQTSTPSSIARKPVPQSQATSPFHQPVLGNSDVITALERGFNTVGGIMIDRSMPWSSSRDAFYVVLSVRGVSYPRAFLRIFSKLMSVTVFAIGTGLFSSCTLVTSLIAFITMTLVLCAGIFGRVTAMWIASEIMRTHPILHRVVQTRDDAAKYMEAILRKPGLSCEVLDHVIVNGRCVKKFGKRMRWSSLIGVLASPYNLNKLAVDSRDY